MQTQAHSKDCTCYECIRSCGPSDQRRKIRDMIRDLLSRDNDTIDDWMFNLVLDTSEGSFSPIAIQFFQEKGAFILLPMIAHDYLCMLPSSEERFPQEIEPKDPSVKREYPTYASMVLARYLLQERDNSQSYAVKDLMQYNLLQIITRSIKYSITTVRRNCVQIINALFTDEKLVNILSDDKQSLLLQSLISEIEKPSNTLEKELRTDRGCIQRELLQEDESREGFTYRYMELLKLDVVRTIKSFMKSNIEKRMILVREKNFVNCLLKQLTVLPHEALPESTCLYDICEIFIILTQIPYQTSDSNFRDTLHDIYTYAPTLIEHLVEAYKKVNNVIVTEYVYDIHRRATCIGLNYDPKEMEKWGLHIYNVRLALLTIVSQLSYERSIADKIATYHDNLVFESALSIIREDCKDPFICFVKSQMDNAPFTNSLCGQGKLSCCGPDIIGICVIIIRNMYITLSDSSKEIFHSVRDQYREYMLKSSIRFKKEGVELVKYHEKQAYREALTMFTIALYVLPWHDSFDFDLLQDVEIKNLYITLKSNRAEMYLQLGEYRSAKIDAEDALSMDPQHEKSQKRRQRALKKL